MYNFYIMDGEKLIDYKPNTKHYASAIIRFTEKMDCLNGMSNEKFLSEYPDQFKQYLYLLIKFISKAFDSGKSYTEDEIKEWFYLISGVNDMVECLTPNEFMQMFPITKDYDGEKYEVKDYFYCTEYISHMDINKPIGQENGPEFLMEYWNWDINRYMCTWMVIVNRMHQTQGGRDITEEFFESQGVHFTTYHEEDGYMVNNVTSERHKILKPQKNLKKLFSV